MSNLDRLAKLLQSVAKIQAEPTAEETIKKAVSALKKQNKLDATLKKQLHDANLTEDIMSDDNIPTSKTERDIFWDYVLNKFAGQPSTKSWAELQLMGKRVNTSNDETVDTADAEIEMDADVADSDFDAEHDIEYSDIDNFIDDISVSDYIGSVYDGDEFEFYDDDDEYDDEYDMEEEKELSDLSNTIAESFNPQVIFEALTRQQRMKMRMAMKRNKAKIAMKRKLALKRHSTLDVLKKRARKLAIRMLKKKYAHKDVSDMSIADRERVEKMLKAKASLVNRLTMKMVPVVRKIENDRFAKKK